MDSDDCECAASPAGLSRREVLLAAGGVTGGLAATAAAGGSLTASGTHLGADRAALADVKGRGRDDFLWISGPLQVDERLRENMFAFARRHDLAVVVVKTRLNKGGVATLRPPLEAANRFDLDVWLNVGVLKEVTAADIATGTAAGEAHLRRLQEVARLHGDLFDDGRVILWQEAPVIGHWTEGGGWSRESVENLQEFGPAVFAAQRQAITSANPALDVGLFVHFPYVVDGRSPEVLASLAEALRERNAAPDFAFVDFYRGWYEKDVGPQPANAAVRSLVRNARAAVDGRDVLYLGQAHTINPNHTPSRQAMLMNVRAALAAEADGLGWYARSSYMPTRKGFDPFVPNVADATFDEGPISTVTIARDRFQAAWLSTFATRDGFDPGDRFDLWLYGNDFGFYDHRLAASADGQWTYIGDFDGYLDGEYPYQEGGEGDAVVFRALDRKPLLGGGELGLRVTTPKDSAGAHLRKALAVPCDPDVPVTEWEAAALLAGEADLRPYSLGYTRTDVLLSPGRSRQITIPLVRSDAAPLVRLREPDQLTARRRLAAFERSGADPRDLFDLWVHGRGLDDPARVPSLLNRNEQRCNPASAAAAVVHQDDVALLYGLARDRFLHGESLEVATDAPEGVRIEAVYAMPYAGRAAFRSAERAAELLADQPAEVATFSLASTQPKSTTDR